MRSQDSPPRRRARGFTLIEVMVVVAIVGILAAIALPSYADYIKRSKIIEATRGLSDMRARMEQYFLDNRNYGGGGCGVDPAAVETNVKAFTITCALNGLGYTVTADGNAAEGMSGFQYTINEVDLQATTQIPAGWSKSATCWTIRKDGSCS